MAISDPTFDLLTALQSKLEAVAVYETYIEDFEEAGDDRGRQLFEEIRRDDEKHAERLRSELERPGQGGQVPLAWKRASSTAGGH